MNRQREISNWQKRNCSRLSHKWGTVRVIVNGNRRISIFTSNSKLNLRNVNAVDIKDQGGEI
jgi:hypothetical protein